MSSCGGACIIFCGTLAFASWAAACSCFARSCKAVSVTAQCTQSVSRIDRNFQLEVLTSTRHIRNPTHMHARDSILGVQPPFKDSGCGLQLFNGSAEINHLQHPANAMIYNSKGTYLEETLWLLQCCLCHLGQPRAYGGWPGAPG